MGSAVLEFAGAAGVSVHPNGMALAVPGQQRQPKAHTPVGTAVCSWQLIIISCSPVAGAEKV